MNTNDKERQTIKNRPRKILSLEERVQALRMFDQTPVYQRVATAFQCSWEQIKNVVLNRDEIMAFYVRCQTIKPKDHPNQVRKKKILFLGNVVFEYIKRALYHGSGVLDETKIRERALEFRDAIEIEKFYPNNAWFKDFTRVYNIDFTCTDNIVLSQPPPKTLDCQKIIEYCRKELDEILKGNVKTFNTNNDYNAESELETGAEKNQINTLDKKISNGKESRKSTEILNDDFEEEINDDEEGETIDFSQFDENDICDSTKSVSEPKKKKHKQNDDGFSGERTYNESNKLKLHTTATAIPSAESTAATITTTTPTTTTTNTQPTKPTQSGPTIAVSFPSKQTNVAYSLRSVKEERRSSSPESAEMACFEPSRATVIREPLISAAANVNARYAFSELTIPAQIFDSKAALSHLFPLQDFALAEEDFVAINLLEKLAAHYRGDLKRYERNTAEYLKNS